jgi:hypothetical protein
VRTRSKHSRSRDSSERPRSAAPSKRLLRLNTLSACQRCPYVRRCRLRKGGADTQFAVPIASVGRCTVDDRICFDCPACGKSLTANPEQAGKRVRCPGRRCAQTIRVPSPLKSEGTSRGSQREIAGAQCTSQRSVQETTDHLSGPPDEDDEAFAARMMALAAAEQQEQRKDPLPPPPKVPLPCPGCARLIPATSRTCRYCSAVVHSDSFSAERLELIRRFTRVAHVLGAWALFLGAASLVGALLTLPSNAPAAPVIFLVCLLVGVHWIVGGLFAYRKRSWAITLTLALAYFSGFICLLLFVLTFNAASGVAGAIALAVIDSGRRAWSLEEEMKSVGLPLNAWIPHAQEEVSSVGGSRREAGARKRPRGARVDRS